MSIPFPNKKYKVIYADPPWEYQDKSESHGGGASQHYNTMSIEDICALPVKEMADTNAVLFVWGTWTHNREVHRVIDSWGFTYKTIGFVWVKTYRNTGGYFFGMGRWTRANTEYCLIATKGKPKRVDDSIEQLVIAPMTEHSKKPNEVRRRIVQLCGDVPRIELFARQKAYGWDVWGNQVENLPTIEEYTL